MTMKRITGEMVLELLSGDASKSEKENRESMSARTLDHLVERACRMYMRAAQHPKSEKNPHGIDSFTDGVRDPMPDFDNDPDWKAFEDAGWEKQKYVLTLVLSDFIYSIKAIKRTTELMHELKAILTVVEILKGDEDEDAKDTGTSEGT